MVMLSVALHLKGARLMRKSKPRIAAFFDLDRTLLSVNSGSLYVKHERKEGRISWLQYFLSALWLLMYHFSLIDMGKAFRRAVSFYQGVSHDELEQRTSEWFHSEVKQWIQPGALVALEKHREAGHPCVLLTGSSSYISRVAIEIWPLDDWLATQFIVDDKGLLTGEVIEPLCYAEGKVYWAEDWAKKNEIDLDASYFYSDSLSDRLMLERVGHPRVISPDPRLRKLARKCGWPILDWQKTEEAFLP